MTDNTQTLRYPQGLCCCTAFMCFHRLLGGAHRFYVGRPVSAVLMLLTFGGLLILLFLPFLVSAVLMLLTLGGLYIWATIDLVYIVVGRFEDKNGLRIKVG